MNLALLLPLCAAIAWAAGYATLEKALGGVSTPTYLFVSHLLWVPTILLLGYVRGSPIVPSTILGSPTVLVAFCASFTFFVAANLLSYSSIRMSGAFLCGAMEIVYPVFIPLFARLFYGAPLSGWRSLISVVLILAGVLVCMRDQTGTASPVPVSASP